MSSWNNSYSACGIRAVDVTAGCVLLVGTEDEAAVFLAQVPRAVRFAQHAEFGQALALALLKVGMRFGDDVLVLHRHHGEVESHHLAGLAGVIPGRRDHVIAGDVALFGVHYPAAGGRLGDPDHRGLAVDRGTARTGAPGQRLGQVGGLDVAVLRMKNAADQSVDVA